MMCETDKGQSRAEVIALDWKQAWRYISLRFSALRQHIYNLGYHLAKKHRHRLYPIDHTKQLSGSQPHHPQNTVSVEQVYREIQDFVLQTTPATEKAISHLSSPTH
jgi:hypothetical protein